jgi:hypothetical protein
MTKRKSEAAVNLVNATEEGLEEGDWNPSPEGSPPNPY